MLSLPLFVAPFLILLMFAIYAFELCKLAIWTCRILRSVVFKLHNIYSVHKQKKREEAFKKWSFSQY